MEQVSNPEMTEAEARDLTEQIRRQGSAARASTVGFYMLFAEAKARQAWTPLGYGSFEAYVEAEFGMSRSYAYRLLDQAATVKELSAAVASVNELSPIGDSPVVVPELVQNEWEARQLKPQRPKVAKEIRRRTLKAPPKERPAVARAVVEEALAERPAPSSPPKRREAPSEPADSRESKKDVRVVYDADDVRRFVSRVVQQTAHNLAHCCNEDQLRTLYERARDAYRLKVPTLDLTEPDQPAQPAKTPVSRKVPAKTATRPKTSTRRSLSESDRCPQCQSMTSDAGRGQRKCLNRACKWTGKVA